MPYTLLVLTLALTFFGTYQRGAPAGDAAGVVRGTVTDARRALMLGAKVVIYNEERRIETATDTDGRFQAHVPEGVYHIQALAPHFCTAARAPFEVAAHSAVTINLTMMVTPIVNKVYKEPGSPVSETDGPECPFRVEKIPLQSTRKADSEVWVQFGDNYESGAMKCYSGYFSERVLQRVIVSYGLFTLYADKVCINDKKELVASGNLNVEQGDGKSQTPSAGDTLNYKELVIKVAPPRLP